MKEKIRLQRGLSMKLSKGFISIYGLFIFQLVIVYTNCIYTFVLLSYETNKLNVELQSIEIQVIKKVVEDYENYEEKNEIYSIDLYTVQLDYDDLSCIIKISKDDEIQLLSNLIYDDYDLFVESYTYIDDND